MPLPHTQMVGDWGYCRVSISFHSWSAFHAEQQGSMQHCCGVIPFAAGMGNACLW